MTTSSAPGKIFLYGEHAVVYGEPAVAAAVDRRVTVSVEHDDTDALTVDAPALDVAGAEIPIDDFSTPEGADGLGYVAEAARAAGLTTGARVHVESELPVGSGLGSSGAVTVAALHALSRAAGHPLGGEELAQAAHQVEQLVQGAASPTDTHLSTHGGAHLVHTAEDEIRPIEVPDLDLVAGDTGARASTADVVARVKGLRDRHPCVEDVLEAMGSVATDGVAALESGDVDAAGELMDVNHGLLEAVGVATPALSRLVHAARDAGSPGAKITGSGGGGCMVALDAPGVTGAIEDAGGRPIPLRFDTEGVRAE